MTIFLMRLWTEVRQTWTATAVLSFSICRPLVKVYKNPLLKPAAPLRRSWAPLRHRLSTLTLWYPPTLLPRTSTHFYQVRTHHLNSGPSLIWYNLVTFFFWRFSFVGLSAPSATNPFQQEQQRLTLNQMRPSSTSPVPSSLPFNAGLPMSASKQPTSLPSTFTQSLHAPLEVPGNLPKPLLPLSTTSTLGDPDQHNQNPFL